MMDYLTWMERYNLNYDIDKQINYERFYSQHLKKIDRTTTGKLTSLCPFHNDSNPSFWVHIESGTYKCEACGETGNIYTFMEKYLKLSKDDAKKKVLEEAGIEKPKKFVKYTLAEYAREKKLPLEFLKELGMADFRSWVAIPYYDLNKNIVRTRYRHAVGSKSKFTWSTDSSKILPYTACFNQEAKYVVVVEV